MLDGIVAAEWQNVKQAPFAFVLVFAVGFGLSSVGWTWYLSERTSALQETVTRYKIAAGIDKPIARTTIMELTNDELKRKAALLVTRIREFMSIHNEHLAGLTTQHRNKKITDDQFQDLKKQEDNRAWKQFETVRVDALMVDDELRARLSPHVQEKIVTAVPHFRSADDPKAIVSLPRLTGPFGGVSLVILAEELEELGKLQLMRLESCRC